MTSPFKETVSNDIHGVFLNDEEFSEVHEIDGVEYVCQVDSQVELEGGSQGPPLDVFSTEVIVRIRADELPQHPVEGQRMNLDGERMNIVKVAHHMGILDIELQIWRV